MNTIYDESTSEITYEYTISEGISKIQGAILGLKAMDYPKEIIQEINDFEEQQPDINNQQGTGNVETEEIQNVIITFTDENGQQKQIIIKFVEK